MDTVNLPSVLIATKDGATLENLQGVHVLQLRGSYRDMGRQHAELAAAVCGDVVSQYLDGLIEKLAAHALPAIARPVDRLLKQLFYFRNSGLIGEDLCTMIAGAAEATGARARTMEKTVLVPDIVHYLAGRSFVPLAVPPMCSGMYAAGAATREGKQLFARNFDFFGRGVWNVCNALVVMRPEGGQRMCWIGALGAPTAPQGFNESGLSFSLHTNFTRDVQTRGLPLFTLCLKIMAQCTTLDEAIHCIEAEPRLCGLSVFLVDAKARKAAVVGFSARRHEVVYPENDVLVRTNHYLTAPMQEDEVAPYPWQRNSRGRYRRIHELLEAGRGALSPENLPAILSDCMDTWECRTRVTGNIVACANTTQSLVMAPDDDALWLATGDHPVAHAAAYRGFNISALLDGEREAYARAPLEGAAQLDAPQRAALHEYEEAWSEYFDNLNSDTAVFHLRRAAAILPDETIFPRMAGILLMKQGKYSQALPLLMKNTRYDYQDGLMRAEAHMWAGRCLDLMRRRGEALTQYKQVVALDEAPLAAAAKRHLKKRFRRMDLLDVAPEFVVGTAIARYRAG